MRRFFTLIVLTAIVAVLTPRDRSHVEDGVVRIAILGDSVAHGAGDESNRGIAGFLDRELVARAVHFVPTANLGINGARTWDLLGVLKSPSAQNLLRVADTVVISIN